MSTQSSFLHFLGEREHLREDEVPSTGFDLVDPVDSFVVSVVSLLVQSTIFDDTLLAHAVALFLLTFVDDFGLLLLGELVLLLALHFREVGLSTSSIAGEGALLLLASATSSGSLLVAIEKDFVFLLPDFGASSTGLSAAAAKGAVLGFFFFSGLLGPTIFFVGLLCGASSSFFFRGGDLAATIKESSEEQSPNENVGFLLLLGLSLVEEVLDGLDFLLLVVVLLGETGAALGKMVSPAPVPLLLVGVITIFFFDLLSGDELIGLLSLASFLGFVFSGEDDLLPISSFALLLFFLLGELGVPLLV